MSGRGEEPARSPRDPTVKDDHGSQVWRTGQRDEQGAGPQGGVHRPESENYSTPGGRVRRPLRGPACGRSMNGEGRGRPWPREGALGMGSLGHRRDPRLAKGSGLRRPHLPRCSCPGIGVAGVLLKTKLPSSPRPASLPPPPRSTGAGVLLKRQPPSPPASPPPQHRCSRCPPEDAATLPPSLTPPGQVQQVSS